MQAVKELTAHPDGIHAVDSGYGRPQLAAIHLIVDGGRAAIVDTGSNASVPRVLAALARADSIAAVGTGSTFGMRTRAPSEARVSSIAGPRSPVMAKPSRVKAAVTSQDGSGSRVSTLPA